MSFESPIARAYESGIRNRLLSMVYAALDGGVPSAERRRFRKLWSQRGTYRLAGLLLNCTHEDWGRYEDTFWIDPWIARHLANYQPGDLCYFVERWLEGDALPPTVSDDPYVENAKLRELVRLHSALNK